MSSNPFSQRSTWWLITAYGDNIPRVEDVSTYPKCVRAVHGGRESCPDTGREHYQGAIECHGQQRGSFFRDWLPGVHFEVAKNKDAVKKYCLKEDTAVGVKGTIENPQVYLKLDDQLGILAEGYHDIVDAIAKSKAQMQELKKEKFDIISWYKDEYWQIARYILTNKPDMASMLANPALEKMWIRTRSVWIARALVLQARSDERSEDVEENLLSPVEVQTNGYASSGSCT